LGASHLVGQIGKEIKRFFEIHRECSRGKAAVLQIEVKKVQFTPHNFEIKSLAPGGGTPITEHVERKITVTKRTTKKISISIKK